LDLSQQDPFASSGRFKKSHAILASSFLNIPLFQESSDPFPFVGVNLTIRLTWVDSKVQI
jgi:hypothetical protein